MLVTQFDQTQAQFLQRRTKKAKKFENAKKCQLRSFSCEKNLSKKDLKSDHPFKKGNNASPFILLVQNREFFGHIFSKQEILIDIKLSQ